jgi:hypothetical protein
MKRNEVLAHAMIRVDFEDTMLCERSQVQKIIFVRSHLHEIPRTGKFIETERSVVVSREWGRGRELFLMGMEFILGR